MRQLSYATIAFGLLLSAFTPERTIAASQAASSSVELPNKPKSVRFAVIGDIGTGKKEQYDVGKQMTLFHEKFPFDFVLMLSYNIYGGKSPADYKRKFEDVYENLLHNNVKFYASLGNHDDTNERFYKPFNMSGQRYYTIKKDNTEFSRWIALTWTRANWSGFRNN